MGITARSLRALARMIINRRRAEPTVPAPIIRPFICYWPSHEPRCRKRVALVGNEAIDVPNAQLTQAVFDAWHSFDTHLLDAVAKVNNLRSKSVTKISAFKALQRWSASAGVASDLQFYLVANLVGHDMKSLIAERTSTTIRRAALPLGWVLDEQVELLSLIGDIALRDGEPQAHADVVVGRSDGTATVGTGRALNFANAVGALPSRRRC
jgi:hypothetical protein